MEEKPKKEKVSSNRSEFWGICCESGKKYSQVVCKKFHVTMAALDPTVLNTSPCVSLLVERGGSEYLLCNLKPDSILQVNLNLFFDKGEKISFYLKGLGTVHLSGYHVCGDQTAMDNSDRSVVVSPFKEAESSSEEEDNDDSDDDSSEDYKKMTEDIQKISASVKSIKENVKKVIQNHSPNTPRTPKATPKKKESSEEESSEDESDEEDGPTVAKAAAASGKKGNTPTASPIGKKVNAPAASPFGKKNNAPAAVSAKKPQSNLLKKMQGTPVKNPPAPKATPKKEESSEEESSEDESDEEDDETSFKKPASMATAKRLRSNIEEESSDSEEESSDEESDEASNKKKNVQLKQKPKEFMNKKRQKMDMSTPAQQSNKKKVTSTPFAEVIDLEDSDSKAPKVSFNYSSELNSSIGRTPMPKKSVSSIHQLSTSFGNTSGLKKNLDNSFDDDDDDDDDESDDEKNVTKSPVPQQANSNAQDTVSKKKKKKKNKAGANESKVETTPAKKGNESVMKTPSGKKLEGGVEYEDIRTGFGPEAKKGKLVHVFYTGKLNNNKVFDSRSPGSKPFSFKLGAGQVIRGWDIGVEGMKVGGKRRLRIPPQMGYKNQRMGEIPPNSTLNFLIELKAVS